MTLHLHEFLFRGRPPGSAEPSAYHVILGDDGEDAFGRPTLAISEALTPEQAEARGFGLDGIHAAINAGLIADLAAARAQAAELAATIETVRTERDEAVQALAALRTEHDALRVRAEDLAAAESERSGLSGRLDLAATEIAFLTQELAKAQRSADEHATGAAEAAASVESLP